MRCCRWQQPIWAQILKRRIQRAPGWRGAASSSTELSPMECNFVRYFSTSWDIFQLCETFVNFMRYFSTSWDIFNFMRHLSTSWDIFQLCEIFFNFLRHLSTLWDIFQLREIFRKGVKNLFTEPVRKRGTPPPPCGINSSTKTVHGFGGYPLSPPLRTDSVKMFFDTLPYMSSWFFVRYLYHSKILREIFINVGSKIISARYIME